MAASFIEQVQKRVNEKTGMFATWLPTDKISVGDYGKINKGLFQIEGNVRQIGVLLEEDVHFAEGVDLAFSDRAEYSINSAIGSDVKFTGSAECQIVLDGKGAFVYQLHNITSRQVANKPEFYKRIVCAIMSRSVRWLDNFVFVDAVRSVGSATIIVSESEAAGVTLFGDMSSGVEGGTPLAQIKGRIGVQLQTGSVFRAVCAKSITPLYNPRRFSFQLDDNRQGAVHMLSSWLRSRFGREIVSPDEILVDDFLSTSAEDRMIFKDRINGEVFRLSARSLLVEEFNGGGPSGGGPNGFEPQYKAEMSSSATANRSRQIIRKKGYG